MLHVPVCRKLRAYWSSSRNPSRTVRRKGSSEYSGHLPLAHPRTPANKQAHNETPWDGPA